MGVRPPSFHDAGGPGRAQRQLLCWGPPAPAARLGPSGGISGLGLIKSWPLLPPAETPRLEGPVGALMRPGCSAGPCGETLGAGGRTSPAPYFAVQRSRAKESLQEPRPSPSGRPLRGLAGPRAAPTAFMAPSAREAPVWRPSPGPGVHCGLSARPALCFLCLRTPHYPLPSHWTTMPPRPPPLNRFSTQASPLRGPGQNRSPAAPRCPLTSCPPAARTSRTPLCSLRRTTGGPEIPPAQPLLLLRPSPLGVP